MKLVQIYNTFGGSNINCGFSSKRALLDFWKKSLEIHKLSYDVVIYTDSFGKSIIENELDTTIIELPFEYIDDRYWNIGKFQMFKEQTEPFIYVDTDAVLYDIIDELNFDVVIEKFRPGFYGKYLSIYNIPKLKRLGIPCGGLIAFKDPSIAVDYANSTIDKIKNTKIKNVTLDALAHIEEIYLASYVEEKELSISTFQYYKHLQGGLK